MRVSVQAAPADRVSWLQMARDVDAARFHRLYVADHPGSSPAPFVALAAAAAVTDRIQLGTCVANAGRWEPLDLANAAATLDVVSGGRALLGVGAGHTPQEWTSTGRPFPSPGERVARMTEVVEATQALLDGEPTSIRGRHVTLVDAVLDNPRPVQERIPLLVGGNGDRVLRFAAQHADIVGITGLGRTLADGHNHKVDWSPQATERTLDHVYSTAAAAGRTPEVEALVQVIEITDDAGAAADRISSLGTGASADDLLSTPFAWIGTIDEIVARLRRLNDQGITSHVIRAAALADARRIVTALG